MKQDMRRLCLNKLTYLGKHFDTLNKYVDVSASIFKYKMDICCFRGLRTLLICVSCLVLTTRGYVQQTCNPLQKSRGYTYPPGDILIEYNTSKLLEIICVVNDEEYLQYQTNKNVSSLMKFQKNKDAVRSDQVEILNATSIKLRVDNPELSNSMYTCLLDGDAVCLNNVAVGRKPQPIDDFKCISYNYDNLTCTWTPKQNYIHTNYTLTFTIPPSRPGRRPTHCPVIKEEGKRLSCMWSMATEPHYRQVHSEFNFTLDVRNALGTWIKSFEFNHFKNVLSGPPVDLKCLNATTHSLYLTWKIPGSMVPFEKGLEHRILYQSSFEPDVWKFGGLIKSNCCEKRDVYFNLTDLEYAHGLYDVRVSIRVQGVDTEELWSKNTSLTAWTESTIPSAPPKANVGSFEIVTAIDTIEYREVYIYWQQLPIELRNGQNFTYHLTVDNNMGVNSTKVERLELTSAYAKFKNLMLSQTYRFSIWSKNTEGLSKDHSVVVVPSQAYRIREPSAFTKTAYSDGVYELSWERPKLVYGESETNSNIKNYSLFWCSHDKDRPYQCAGYLNWTEVSADTTVYNITVPENQTMQFAISANNETSSSGMMWAACTVIYNQPLGKMKDVWIMKVGSHFIEVGWKLDCADRIGAVKGFVIYYCPIVSPNRLTCKGSQKNVTIEGDASVTNGRVENLTPYTTYMLTVSVKTKTDTYSHQSDPMFNTTFEAEPTEPLNLKASNITNSSVVLTWDPPKQLNGPLGKYKIYNNNSIMKTIDMENKSAPFTAILTDLGSYLTYNFTVVACTKQMCSVHSQPLLAQTKIGIPSRINAPKVSFQNKTYIVIKWEKPHFPRGRNEFYEVKFTEKLDSQNRTMPIFNVTDMQYSLENCGNEGSYNTFFISIRAINIDNGTRYIGPWSQELEAYCQPGGYMYLIFIVIMCAAAVVLFFLGRRVYCICKRMQNVGIKLPDGLDPKNTENVWNSQKGASENTTRPPADEELLLSKIGDGKQSAESTGSTSGHGSVTPSLQSGTSLSNTSDSGTEQPDILTNEDANEHSEQQPQHICNTSKSGVYVPVPEPNKINAKSNQSENYCVLGVDPTPYETEPPVKPPYVLTGDIHKTLPLGYLPINKESEKNPAYVMAGNKNAIMSDLLHHGSTDFVEEKPMYVQVADVNGSLKVMPPQQDLLTKVGGGYVSFGDVPTSRLDNLA